ncbi:MAG TPA: DNA polymerase Y family protein, partial [Actinoplanes sp.]|nr:DNA polymerase Y family protein [Actinoplanes sp.]
AAAAERIVEQVAQACLVESQVGIADGVFAAGLAARVGRIIPVGQTPDFLAEMPVEALDRPELVDLLRRFGLRTLGGFAALPASDVLTRFGFDGALAHRLAAGLDHRPLAARRPPPDLDVTDTFDEPLERVDVAAFAGRALAERLHERLAAHGLACTRLGIEAVTANGQELHRVWRHDGTLTAAAIAERVRWQLDGWLSGSHRAGAAPRPTAGLVRLRLIPDGVLVHLGLQPGLWGDAGAEHERAHRALSRVQGLLGPDAVVTAVLGGGRSPDDQVRFVPWGDERVPTRPGTAPTTTTAPVSVIPAPVVPVSVAPVSVVPAPGAPARLRSVAPSPDSASASTDAVVVPFGKRPGTPSVPASVPAPVVQPRPAEPRPAELRPAELKPAAGPRVARESGAGLQRPAGAVARGARRPTALPPWPGRLPAPAPALVLPQPLPAVVRDAAGALVGVSARLEVTGSPASLSVGTTAAVEIVGWVGPWPVDERWWADEDARRRARFQIGLADGRALLLSLAAGQWSVEASYD